MGDIDLQIYIYALYFLIFSSISAFLFVIRSLRNIDLAIDSIRLYNLYFVLGLIGWIALGSKDAALIELNLSLVTLFYIVCSFILFLAVAECNKLTRISILASLIHIVILFASQILTDDISRILFISIYAFFIYSVIAYISIQHSTHENNAGRHIIGIAATIVVIAVPFQIYALTSLKDISLAYGIMLVTNSTGFMLVGIGFLTSILINEHNQLTLLSLKDPLTGLLNRRGMDYTLSVSIGSAERLNKNMSAIAIDLDFFKKVNDEFGHYGGDLVLRKFSQILVTQSRPSDVCCRLGGEEFIIILTETRGNEAKVYAERIRLAVEKMRIPFNGKNITLTASFGIANQQGNINLDKLLKDADEALYVSKNNGRNCITPI